MSIHPKHMLLACSIFLSAFSFGQTMEKAIQLTKNEEFDLADKAFKSLINAQPSNGALYFYEGENFFEWGKMDSAQAAYQKGITINATNALNYTGLGKVQWYNGNSKDALDNFYKAKVISKSKDAVVLDKIAEAYINAPTKDIRTAIDLLNQATVIDPKNTDVLIDMGDAYLSQNDGSSAVSYYEKATSINSVNVVAMLRLGQLYGRARNYDLSFQYFQRATIADSNFAPAYRAKAEMLYSANRIDEAIGQYKKYLQLNNATDARIRYASFLYLAKKYPDAIKEIQTIFQKDTSSTILYRIMGYSLYEAGKYKDGLDYINKFFAKAAITKTKVLPSDYAYQGKLLSKNGKDSLAIEKMKQALVRDSSDAADLYTQIANIYYKNGNYPLAVKYFSMRVKLPQPTVNDYNGLGRAAYSNRQYQKADSAFAIITKYMADLPLGYLWRAYCNSSIDSMGTQGLAKPFYEQYIQKAAKDSLKNKDGLINAYDYLGYYYVTIKDFDKATYYYKKTMELDPNDTKAASFFKNLKALKQPGKKEGDK